jgi:uncharacterized Zn finger protein
MAQQTRTWWGKRFIDALESFTDRARLGRGRSYANSRRIRSHTIATGTVTAKIEGNVNPYFGVYKTPIYNTTVQIAPISDDRWTRIIERIASKASLVSRLLINEMPEEIEDAFAALGSNLLPRSRKDFKTGCDCPDDANPCKHIAGLCYFMAARLDQDPFLLFELRGLSRKALKAELTKTPLGKALARALEGDELEPQPVEFYYTTPARVSVEQIDYHSFWHGEKRLPATLEPLPPPGLPAVLIRKAGDYPPFWKQKTSFIDVMSEFYERVRKQHKDVL